MVAKSIGLQDAMVRESRVCDAGTRIISWKISTIGNRNILISCDVVDSLAVSNQKEPHPAAWESKNWCSVDDHS